MSIYLLSALAIVVLYLMFRRYTNIVMQDNKRAAVMNDKYQWMAYGLDRDWVRSYCATHDYWHTSEEEEMFEEFDDPCIPIFRLMHGDR